jgi:cytochrome c oxidase subunit 4
LTDHPEVIERAHPVEHPHPQSATYIKIAVVLGIITALEVAVYYILTAEMEALLPPTLLLLSALKFGLVVAFYMHLKFDSRLFTGLFLGGLALALSVVLAIMTMMGVWTHVPVIEH